MIFTKKRSINVDHLSLKIDGKVLKQKQATKFLGLTIDNHLSWVEHINQVSSKICRSLYIINRVKHALPLKALKTLYFSLIHPHLQFGVAISQQANTGWLDVVLTSKPDVRF